MEILTRFLKHILTQKDQNKSLYQTLYYSVEKKEYDMLQILIDQGLFKLQKEFVDEFSDDMLRVSIRNKDFEQLKILINFGFKVTRFTVEYVLRFSDRVPPDILEYVVSLSKDNRNIDISSVDLEPKMYEFLVRHEINPNFLLRESTRSGNIDRMRDLLQRFPWLDPNDSICFACYGGQAKALDFLIKAGARPLDRENPLLEHAVRGKSLEVVKLLLSIGVGLKNRELYYACSSNRIDMVKCLVEAKADINKHACTEFCFVNGSVSIGNYLMKHGGILRGGEKTLKYIRERRFFRKWRIIHFRNWIRRVVIPLYFSPGFPGCNRVKKDLEGMFQ